VCSSDLVSRGSCAETFIFLPHMANRKWHPSRKITNQVCCILCRSNISYHNLKVGFALIPESLKTAANTSGRLYVVMITLVFAI
jgi:hypothetical protein